jgi:ribonuclease P protein component
MMGWINHNDADLQTPEPQAGEQARVQGAHEDEGRSQGVEPSSEARSDPSGGHDRSEVTAASPARKERLPRSARIRHSTEIRALLERGKRKRTTNVDVFFTPSPASHSRLGLIVPKHGRKIVERNRLKRRLREIGRREVLPVMDASSRRGDLLIRARRAAYDAEFGQLRLDVHEAVEALCSDES